MLTQRRRVFAYGCGIWIAFGLRQLASKPTPLVRFIV